MINTVQRKTTQRITFNVILFNPPLVKREVKKEEVNVIRRTLHVERCTVFKEERRRWI